MHEHPQRPVSDGILHCVISDPDRAHSLSREHIEDATRKLRDHTGANGPIRAVVVTGAQGTFCNGGDVKAFADADAPGLFVRDLADCFHDFISALTTAPVPVVAAVEGWAAGAGMSIACASDIIIGGPSTRFVTAYAGIGFSPDGGMSWSLPRLVGLPRALDLLLTNTPIDGARAYEIGLLSRLVDDDQVVDTAWAIARKLSTGSAPAAAATKQLARGGQNAGLRDQLEREAESIAHLAASPDGREGVSAFLRQVRPRFA
ncbi:enoyl-CoA hydratase-related protein [Rhodococcus sp. USK13]|uniref:enoyl-CoA hydratase/isomerase family protein n=1 Tax=Rhodococcus sp. USK13 TaxID=2806442 RepID=UPI001BD15CC4|nr:enoyl-CoA hydratase-related protein [Rhodococcus sp. USK13]